MDGALIVFVLVALLVLFIVFKTAVVVPQQSAFVVERLGRYHATLNAGLSHPGAVRRCHPLPALAQGDGDRHPGAGLHHARQRAGRRRRHPLPEGAQPRARLVRHLELHLRHHPARADDAAQRGGQDRSRSHVRGAHDDQHRRSSASSTRRRRRGASRCCATRSRTSSRRPTSSPRWRSRCAPSARSAR